MIYILSDLEGVGITNVINQITPTPSKICITGDIINSSMVTFDINILEKFKSNNLNNIDYCLCAKNLTLILENRDLCKIKLINALKINTSICTDEQRPYFIDFNNGNIEMTQTIYDAYFSGIIPWKYSLENFNSIWNKNCTEPYYIECDYNAVDSNINNKSHFITRFKYIFIHAMASGNLLYSIPYEINEALKKTNNPELINISESFMINLINKLKDNKSVMDDINTDDFCDFDHCAFIVCAIFISLLQKSSTPMNFENPTNIIFTNNSNFCRSMLYNLYIKPSTSMIYLYNNKYLLSHSGITKYYINVFKTCDNIDLCCSNIYNNTSSSANLNTVLADTLSIEELNTAIKNSNNMFKKWIHESYDIDTIISDKALKYISFMTNENTNYAIMHTDPFNIDGRQFCSPIGPGFVGLTNSDIKYILTNIPIIQIFGYKLYNFSNSFYIIDDKNMLTSLDGSNSFSTPSLNNNEIPYNYIYVNDSGSISKSTVYLN